MTTNNHKTSTSKKLEVAGLAAGVVAAAAAGVYFLYGSKNAKKYRSVVKSWMFKAKSEILERLERLENVSEADYHNVVDTVLAKYKSLKDIDAADVSKFLSDIKKQWSAIKKQSSPAKKKTIRAKAK